MPRRAASRSRNDRPCDAPDAQRGLVGRMLTRLRGGQDLRREKIRRLRRQIRAGAYENDLKLQIALQRLLEGE